MPGRDPGKTNRDDPGPLFRDLTSAGEPETPAGQPEQQAETIINKAVFTRDPKTGQQYFATEPGTKNTPESFQEFSERYSVTEILNASTFFDQRHPSLQQDCDPKWRKYVTDRALRQLAGADLFVHTPGRMLLQANTGTGKTPTALAALAVEFTRQPYNSIILPTHILVGQTIDRIKNFLPGVEVLSLAGKSAQARQKFYNQLAEDLVKPDPPKRLLVFTAALANDLEAKDGKPARLDPALLGTLVVDEAHKTVGKAAYAKVARALHDRPNRVLLLTATPGRDQEELDKLCDDWNIGGSGGLRWPMRLPDQPRQRETIVVPLTRESKPAIIELEKLLYNSLVKLGKATPETALPATLQKELQKLFKIKPANAREWLRALFFKRPHELKRTERIIAGNYRFKIPSHTALSMFNDFVDKKYEAEIQQRIPSRDRVWANPASRAAEVGYLHYLLSACVSSGEAALTETFEKLIDDTREQVKVPMWKQRLIFDVSRNSEEIALSPLKPLGKFYTEHRKRSEPSGLQEIRARIPKIAEALDQLIEDKRTLEGGAILRVNLKATARLVKKAIELDSRFQQKGITVELAFGGRENKASAEQARKNFAEGKTNILIGTSVIDLGVDTPAMLGILFEPQPEPRVVTQFEGRISRQSLEGSASVTLGRVITLVSAHPIDQRKMRSSELGVQELRRTNDLI